MMLYCFEYDPSAGRYSATILGIMRVGAVLTIAGLLFVILFVRRRDHAPRTNLNQQGAH